MISKAVAKEFQHVAGKQNIMIEEADRLTYSYNAAVLEPEMPALRGRTAAGHGKPIRRQGHNWSCLLNACPAGGGCMEAFIPFTSCL